MPSTVFRRFKNRALAALALVLTCILAFVQTGTTIGTTRIEFVSGLIMVSANLNYGPITYGDVSPPRVDTVLGLPSLHMAPAVRLSDAESLGVKLITWTSLADGAYDGDPNISFVQVLDDEGWYLGPAAIADNDMRLISLSRTVFARLPFVSYSAPLFALCFVI